MNIHGKLEYIEGIYVFEVNTKYISSSVGNSDVFKPQDEIYFVFTEIKVNFLFSLYRLHAMSHPLKKEVPKMKTFCKPK